MKKMIVGLALILLILGCSFNSGADGKISKYNFFPELSDEYKITSYFMNSQEKAIYKKLDKEQRTNFLYSFWQKMDPNPVTSGNEQVEELRKEIQK